MLHTLLHYYCYTTLPAAQVFIFLMFVTPVFHLVPNNVLGAIVISSVIGLLDYPEAIFLFKVGHPNPYP